MPDSKYKQIVLRFEECSYYYALIFLPENMKLNLNRSPKS